MRRLKACTASRLALRIKARAASRGMHRLKARAHERACGMIAAMEQAALRVLLITLLAGFLCSACRAPAQSRPGPTSDSKADSVTVYVARRKWHIDVGFAVRTLDEPLAGIARRFPGASHVFFGFGDRHYLLARDKGASDMLGALWPGPALILATAIKSTPAQAFGASEVIELEVTAAQAHAIEAFIREALVDGEVYAPGPYEDSLYFAVAATNRYSAIHTCNTWAAEALRAGGLPVRAKFVVFAGQLWSQLRDRSSLLNHKGADYRCDTPRSACFPAARLPSFSAAGAGSSC